MRIIVLLYLALPFFAAAQSSQKPEKLSYHALFFSEEWRLGEKTVKQKAVGLHLEKYNTETAKAFSAMRRANNKGIVWAIVASAGVIGAVLSDNTNTGIGFATVAVGSSVGTIACSINSVRHRKQAIQIYNRAYGY